MIHPLAKQHIRKAEKYFNLFLATRTASRQAEQGGDYAKSLKLCGDAMETASKADTEWDKAAGIERAERYGKS
jgi:hypothetical protein